MDKTICIHPTIKDSAFVQGFLTASNWVQLPWDYQGISCVDIIPITTGYEVYVCDRAKSIKESVYSYAMQTRDKKITYCYAMNGQLMFSKYLVSDSEESVPDEKLIQTRWNRLRLNKRDPYEIGLQFGIFTADAVNEESWLEMKERNKTQQVKKDKNSPEGSDNVGINEG